MKNNYRKTLNNELYKTGLGVSFCKEISDCLCQMPGDHKENLEWIQYAMKERLTLIKKAIQNTLIEEKIKTTQS